MNIRLDTNDQNPNQKLPLEIIEPIFLELYSLTQIIIPVPDTQHALLTCLKHFIFQRRTYALKFIFHHPQFISLLTPYQMNQILVTAVSNLDYVKLIVQHPEVDVNTQDDIGATAIGWTIYRGAMQVFDYLFEYRTTNIHLKNNWGQNILFGFLNLDRVELLLYAGIDYQTPDLQGRYASSVNRIAMWKNKKQIRSNFLWNEFTSRHIPRDIQSIILQYILFYDPL